MLGFHSTTTVTIQEIIFCDKFAIFCSIFLPLFLEQCIYQERESWPQLRLRLSLHIFPNTDLPAGE